MSESIRGIIKLTLHLGTAAWLLTTAPGANANLIGGLIAHYEFSGDATDSIGGQDGTVAGGASLTEDRFGNSNSAYLFDGVDDYIQIPITSSSLGSEFTISAWVYTNKTIIGDPKMAAVSSDRSSNRGTFLGVAANDTPSFNVFTQTNQYGAASSNTLTLQEWVLLTLTYKESGSANLYVNGVSEIVQANPVGSPVGDTFRIGNDPYDAGVARYWGGRIDDVRFYNRALTADEVRALAVPEPTTLALLSLGMVGLGWSHRRATV